MAGRRVADCGALGILASSEALFALYRGPPGAPPDGATAYARALPALRAALPRLRDPELDVDALVQSIERTAGPGAGGPSNPGGGPPPLSDVDALLLLAAFVGSRSPRERDARLFTHDKGRGKRRKTEKRDATKIAQNGPQPVALDRLLSIHAYLAAEHRGEATDVRDPRLLRALANLTGRRLLERAPPLEDLANPRFTCLLDTTPAYDLADAARLPLGRYLPS